MPATPLVQGEYVYVPCSATSATTRSYAYLFIYYCIHIYLSMYLSRPLAKVKL